MNRYRLHEPKPANYFLPGYTWWLKKKHRNALMLDSVPYKVRITAHSTNPLEAKYIKCIQWYRKRKNPWITNVDEDFFRDCYTPEQE